MTATEHGFVQQHEIDAVEGTLCQRIESWLTKEYGKKQARISSGLRWLTGNPFVIEAGWMDHPEYRKKDGKRTFIGRPYHLTLEDTERVVTLAKTRGLRLLITCPSNYNLDTVLIILTEQV